MLNHFFKRELGLLGNKDLLKKEITKRDYTISTSLRKEIIPTHLNTITKLDIDPCENRFLISCSLEPSINIFDLELMHSPEKVQFKPIVAIGPKSANNKHKKGITSASWYPIDTGMFVTSSLDFTVNLWDTNCEEVIRTFNGECGVNSIHLSPCAQSHSLIAAASEDAMIHLCDIRTGKSIWKLTGHTQNVLDCKWSPGQQYLLASGSEDGSIRLWDTRKTNSSLLIFDQHLDTKSISTTSMKKSRNFSNVKSHHGAINGLCFTPDSMKLLSTGSDNVMRCWSVFDGSNDFVHYSGVKNQYQKWKLTNSLTVSQNGELVYHPSDSFITIYEIKTGEVVNTLKNHFKPVNSCVYNPELQHLYSGGFDLQINSWIPYYDEIAEVEEMESNENWSIEEENSHGW